jgi:hypothetical protein
VVEGQAEGIVLGLVPARADPQDKAAAADLVERVRHLRQHRRIAERVAEHQRAKLDALSSLGQRREHRPTLPDADRRLIVGPVQQVVVQPERVEAERLGRQRHLAYLGVALGAAKRFDLGQQDDETNIHRCLSDA